MSITPASIQQARSHPTDPSSSDNDEGFVLVTIALLFAVLLAFIGYSVDLGRVNSERNQAQAAAEAAALGGVTFLPDNAAQAEATARQIAALHGYTTNVSVTRGSGGNRLIVSVDDTVDHYFVSVIGNEDTAIRGRAEAEFQPELQLGSPEIVIGNDPETGYTPNYWLSIAGTDAPKDLGDQFMTRECVDPATAGCGVSGGMFLNTDQENRGYNFAIPVTTPGQVVRIQVFDPSWIWTGGDCTFPFFPTAAEIADLQTVAPANGVPAGYYNDAAIRYASGPTEWCTGDDLPGTNGSDIRFTVRLPDDTPWDDFDNPITTCSETFGGYKPMSPYLPPSPSIYDLLNPNGGTNEWKVNSGDGVWTFAEVFRRWVTICELSVPVTGDLMVQAQSLGGQGQNRFSLRAGPPDGVGGVLDVGQSTYARGRLPIYVNSDSTTTVFKPIRITPAASERSLEVTFFDIGDATSAGTLRIRPPADSNMSTFPGCEFTRSNSPNPLVSNNDCSLSGVLDTNGYDGQVVSVSVPIPDTYSCPAGPNDCWVSVEATFTGGITDATTWTAKIEGDAVRIVG